MKHRSVIAFVIVAAALFAAPQLSHDLQTLRSALGSRLSGGLMRAFLSLPSTEGAAAVAPPRAAARLASCTKEQRPASKQRKSDSAPRAEVRAAQPSGDQLAMIGEPLPVPEPWTASLPGGALVGAAELPHKTLGDVAMIIPPDSGVDPRALAGAYRDAAQGRKLAERVRASYVATRFEAKGVEWRKVEGELREEDLRAIEKTLPGSFEFRLDRDGSKTKALKVKRGTVTCCAPPAPHAPRPSGVDAAAAPLPAVASLTAFVSE
jgi:hypothetical protein